jgi:hypothetical protein
VAPDQIFFTVVLVALAAWVWVLGVRTVGKVAAMFGEDPRRWQRLMLPFGVLGPLIAYLLLGRGGRGGGRGLA